MPFELGLAVEISFRETPHYIMVFEGRKNFLEHNLSDIRYMDVHNYKEANDSIFKIIVEVCRFLRCNNISNKIFDLFMGDFEVYLSEEIEKVKKIRKCSCSITDMLSIIKNFFCVSV